MAWPFDLTQEFWEWLRGNKPGTLAPEVRTILVSAGDDTLEVDPETNALETIDTFHAAIHAGIAYYVNVASPFGAELPNGEALDLVIRTPVDKECHMVFGASSLGDAEFTWVRGTTVVGATLVTPLNKNFTSTNVTTLVAGYNNGGGAPPAPGGTTIISIPMPGGKVANAVGSGLSLRNNDEWKLVPNEIYLFRVVNRSGLARITGLELMWYETSD